MPPSGQGKHNHQRGSIKVEKSIFSSEDVLVETAMLSDVSLGV